MPELSEAARIPLIGESKDCVQSSLPCRSYLRTPAVDTAYIPDESTATSTNPFISGASLKNEMLFTCAEVVPDRMNRMRALRESASRNPFQICIMRPHSSNVITNKPPRVPE